MSAAVTPATRLRSVVGDKTSRALAKAFGMERVDDLLRHYPRRYVPLGELTDLASLRVGQYATVMARVAEAKNHSFRRGRGRPDTRTEVTVTDGNTSLTLTFFRQPWRQRQLAPGTVGLFAGEVGEFRGRLQLTHPLFEPIEGEDQQGGQALPDGRIARGIIPIYPASGKVSSFTIEKAVAQVLAVTDVDEPLPESVRTTQGLPGAAEAFEHVHRPREAAQWQRARDRFRFEEAFVIQTVFAQRRRAAAQDATVARPRREGGIHDLFVQRLPFTLTDGQQQVVDEISADLAATHPMHRLLQGEVGSGKTIVALMAMLQVVDAGGQAALLAPTEVLAAQHHRAITTMLGTLAAEGMLGGEEQATRVRLLTGSMGAAARRESLLDAASGAAGIVIGTHALIQDKVQLADLGLLVVDEQHRFGVEQRAALVDRAESRPHVLVMTATPIPRTVAMTVFGDLEVSTLTELPAGRQPIQTNVVPVAERPAWLERAWERVGEEVAKGRQAYVVVSRIGAAPGGAAGPRAASEHAGEHERSDDAPDTRSLVDVHAELSTGPLADLRVEALHGRLPPEEKDAVMSAFARGEVDVLVATTVVEVGVDVPNATVMVILDADRFGMSQLHQLRGRVGRGREPGLCLLVTDADAESPAAERLTAVAGTNDGFELSRLDAELRREGDVLGASQSGFRSSLRLLSVVKDEAVIAEARDVATAVVEQDPELADLPMLRAAIARLEETEQAEYLERT
ncbi:ATP-dependent DNA helicase RecG [Aeromicrobium sp. CTD01-1L150]|uniref:ATP-dependent DNA helicase RecG n=1 Tax=Aeromicrobium sp. CTD01-1L150 TaxID=3341830 RepID=UPI0035C129C0